MTASLRRIVAAAAALALVAAPAAAYARSAFHLHLLRSDPAADATLAASPRAIRLTFTEAPELRVTSIRLTDAAGHRAALGAVAAARGDRSTVWAAVRTALAPGRYRVEWRTMAHDGHPMHGDFHFTVAAPHAHH